MVYVVPRATWLLFSRRGIELRALGMRTAIWGCVALVAFGLSCANNAHSREGERVIIAAVHRYRNERGRYPDALDELVPRYLPSVPRARLFPSMFARFEYGRYGDDANLTWTLYPPFGRPFYVFNQRRHGHLD